LNENGLFEFDNIKIITKFWRIANDLRGDMTIHDYEDYFMGLIFYKIISDKAMSVLEEYLQNKSLENNINDITIQKELQNEQRSKLGYHIEREYLFNTIVESNFLNGYINRNELEHVLNSISRNFGNYHHKIFEGVTTNLNRYSLSDRLVYDQLQFIDSFFNEMISIMNYDYALLFNSLIEIIPRKSFKNGNRIITPKGVADLLAKLVSIEKTRIRKLYDPTCGAGSLLQSVVNETCVEEIYGQELNINNYNMAIMKMITNGKSSLEYNLELGDVLYNPMHLGMKFDCIVAHPPSGKKWNNINLYDDARFNYIKPAPKSSADLAYVQHMIYHLKEFGITAIILPTGVLFRSNAERGIRKHLVDNDYLDAVIRLPSNILYETGIQTCILIFKKNRSNKSVIIIDASSDFKKVSNKNILTNETISKIVDVYKRRSELKSYSAIVTKQDIEKHDYNLSIHKYIDIFEMDMLMKNYNFKKFRLGAISQISQYNKAIENEKCLFLRIINPKVINSSEVKSKVNYLSIVPDSSIICVEYLEYFFATPISETLFKSISTDTNRISIKELKDLEIPIPEYDVQLAIVKSQNQIDETINELRNYSDSLANNPNKVNDLTYKLIELRNAIRTNNRIDHIKREIARGESIYLEFKRDFSNSEEKIIRTIYSFLNTEGGRIYVGVEDDGTICGLKQHEIFTNDDDLILKFTNKFRDKIPQYLGSVDVEAVDIDDKKILVVVCKKSQFPAIRKKVDKTMFYIRKNRSSQQLQDIEEIIKYVYKNFDYRVK